MQPGVVQRVQLGAGKTAAFDIDVRAGTLARLVIDQDDPALNVRITSPDGIELRNAIMGAAGRTLLSVHAVSTGRYQFSLSLPANRSDQIVVNVSVRFEPVDASRYTLIKDAEQCFLEGQRATADSSAGSMRRALAWFIKAESRFARAKDAPGQALAALRRGDVLVLLGEFPGAGEQYLKSEHMAPDKDWRLQVLIARARMWAEFWDGDKTLAASQPALDLSRELHDRRSEAAARASHAEGLYLHNDYVPARRELDEAYELARSEGDRVTMARTRRTMVWLEKDEGHVPNALDRADEAQELFRRVGDLRSEVAEAMDIAMIHAERGELQGAIRTHLSGAEFSRKMALRVDEAFAATQLGIDYSLANNDRVAVFYYQQKLRLARAVGMPFLENSGLRSLCTSEIDAAQFDAARANCSKALQLATAMHQPKLQAVVLVYLGDVEARSGHPDRALTLYTQAADLSHSVDDPRWEAAARLALGRLSIKKGDDDRALDQYRRALSLSTSVEDANTAIAAHGEIARVERARGNLDKARSELEAALQLAEAQRTKAGSGTLRSSYFASVRESYELYAQVLLELHKQRPDDGFDRVALEQSEKAHARTLLDSLVERNAELTQARDPETARRMRGLRSQIEAASNERTRLLAYGGSRKQLDANIEHIRLLNADYDTLRSSSGETTAMAVAASIPSATAEQIQQEVLDPDTTLVEYLVGDESGIGWAVTQQNVVSFALPARRELESPIQRWHRLMLARKPRPGEAADAYAERVRRADRELQLVGAKLACVLLGPVASQLKTSRLVIVPDGSLESVAFSALPLDGCARGSSALLASRFEVTVVPSASSVMALRRELRTRPAATSGIAVLADPVFTADDPRIPGKHAAPKPLRPSGALAAAMRDLGWNSGIPRLPGTRLEANTIKSRAPDALKKTDFEASLSTALQPELARYRILHFATHGLLDSEQPEFSGLILSLVDRKGHDQNGYLSAQDIYEQHLESDLVVLSACDSGLGATLRGEGVVGLARAFLHAGAARVVSSLWKVDDDATSELMRHFYDGMLRDRKPPAEALRYAQLKLMREKRWSAPFYWAGFVLNGEWR